MERESRSGQVAGPERPASPFNPVSPVVLGLAAIILAVEIVLSAGAAGLVGPPEAVGWRISAIGTFGVSGPLMHWMVETRSLLPEGLLRLVSYLFVHGGFTHAALAVVMLLALGKMVGDVYRPLAVLALFLLPGVVGAVVWALLLDQRLPLYGAYPGIFGLIGAYSYLGWRQLSSLGRAPLKAFALVAVLLGIQLGFGLFLGGNAEWVADLSAFVAGFALAVAMYPGLASRALARIRAR